MPNDVYPKQTLWVQFRPQEGQPPLLVDALRKTPSLATWRGPRLRWARVTREELGNMFNVGRVETSPPVAFTQKPSGANEAPLHAGTIVSATTKVAGKSLDTD